MNPIFNTTICDSYYGDVFPNAITRVQLAEVFVPSAYKLKANEQDEYEKQETESDELITPVKVTYSIEYWLQLNNKRQGKPSREYKRDSESVFEVDFSGTEIMREWDAAGEDYNKAVIRVCQWHFTNKVLKGL